MKKLFIIIASVSLFAVTASAHDRCEPQRRLVGYTECGTPIFATLEVVGHNRCGEPIFQWVTHYPREAVRHDSDFHGHRYSHEEERHHHSWR